MSRTTEKARAAVTAAEADHARWATTLADAEASAAAAQEAVAETPDDLDRIGAAAALAHAKASAARRALVKAVVRLADARRGVLVAEADDEAEMAKSTRKAADAHTRKVNALLTQLQELDGVPYGPEHHEEGRGLDSKYTGRRVEQVSRRVVLWSQVRLHDVRAAVLRYVAENDAMPYAGRDLPSGVVPYPFNQEPLTGEQIPAAAREYLATLAPAAV